MEHHDPTAVHPSKNRPVRLARASLQWARRAVRQSFFGRLDGSARAASFVTALLLVSTAVLMPQGLKEWSAAPSARIAAERNILRLPPAAFPELPATIQRTLEREGCRIPQRDGGSALRSIVRGEFARTGQLDWAVICSKQNRSSIRVFWGGAASCPATLAMTEDSRFLRPLPSGELEFAREIDVDGPRESPFPAGGGALARHGLVERVGADILNRYVCAEGRWVALEEL
jgi:hypothetical protein